MTAFSIGTSFNPEAPIKWLPFSKVKSKGLYGDTFIGLPNSITGLVPCLEILIIVS